VVVIFQTFLLLKGVFCLSRQIKSVFLVCCIGCGGTGGAFCTQFARFAAHHKDDVGLVIIDGDLVEAKNIERQPFFNEDLALNKAVALASGIESSFDVPVLAYPEYIDSVERLRSIISSAKKVFFSKYSSYMYDLRFVPIIVGAVDNHRARVVLHDLFCELEDCIYIDSANEFSYGEICYGVKCSGAVLSPDRVFYFPEVLEPAKSRLEMSCSELNDVQPQHYATNIMAANLVFSAISHFITDGKFPSGITYFDVFECRVQNRPYSEFVSAVF